ncbi:hypothetical protein EC988_008626, partial [Linderina pennispora]
MLPGRGRGRGRGRGWGRGRGRGRGFGASHDYTHGYNHQSAENHGSSGRYGDAPGKYRLEVPPPPKHGVVSRTLFISVPQDTIISGSDIHDHFAKYGEIADIFDASIRQKGICYVSYYDSRCALEALKENYNTIRIGHATVTVVPSDLRPGSDKRCPAANDRQATVLFSLVSPKESFQDKDKAYFERFGNVVSFFPYRGRQFEYVVEYYDSRSAYHAAMSCNRLQFHGGTMHTTFLWDGSTEGSVVYDKVYFDRLCGGSNDGAASFSMLSGPNGQEKPKEWNIDYGVSSGWSASPQ